MHRLFNDKAKPYVLIDVKTNSEESSCAKKLFLYGFSLSMLSYMNYICIHSDSYASVSSHECSFFSAYNRLTTSVTNCKQ